MREMIKILQHEGQQLHDARDLHEKLCVQSRFNDWIVGRIEKYGFVENQDYVTFTENLVNGGRRIEYGLTSHMLKELCMVENNEHGRVIRTYYIKMEQEALKARNKPTSLPDRKELARWVIEQADQIEELKEANSQKEKTINHLTPKAALMEMVLDADQKIDIGQAAKILGLPYGRNTLFAKLRAMGIFFKNRNEPLQEYVERGYFQLKEKFINRDNHQGFVVIKVLVTQRGLEYLATKLGVIQSRKQLAAFA